jgi:hypothetical protein
MAFHDPIGELARPFRRSFVDAVLATFLRAQHRLELVPGLRPQGLAYSLVLGEIDCSWFWSSRSACQCSPSDDSDQKIAVDGLGLLNAAQVMNDLALLGSKMNVELGIAGGRVERLKDRLSRSVTRWRSLLK